MPSMSNRYKHDELVRLAESEILRLSALRTQTGIKVSEGERSSTNDRMWGLYKTILRNARQNPDFSLRKTLGVFRFLTTGIPDLNKQIEEDYRELNAIGVENPFHSKLEDQA